MIKRYTEADVKKEIAKAKRRLKNLSSKTGVEYILDTDYYLNMKSRKAAVLKLKDIKVANVKHGNEKVIKRVFKNITVKTDNKVLDKGDSMKVLTAEGYRYKTTGRFMNAANIGKRGNSVEGFDRFARYFKDKQDYAAYTEARNERALNNYVNNIELAADGTADPVYKAVAAIVKDKINSGELTAKILQDKGIATISQINLFDSDQGDLVVANASTILKVLREYIPITDEEIINKCRESGMDEESIEEFIKML